MTFELMSHQQDGVDFLTKRCSGLLAFEQGLGKTLVAIDAFNKLRMSGKTDKLLVICPNSLKRNWVSELSKFAPGLTVCIAEGKPRERRNTFAQSDSTVIITSYETARSEVTAILALLQRSDTTLVLDESHATKNKKSLTSIAARHFSPHCNYRWLLSGTPVTNSASDLYTQIDILTPEEQLLGSMEAFLETIEHDPQAEFIQHTFDRLILRRTKEECLDLPTKSFIDLRIDLPDWQRSLYDDMRTQMVCDIKAMSGEQYRAFASTALAQLTRLIQLASNPSLIFPELTNVPGKFEALDGVVSDIVSVPSRKVIIWSSYVRSIEMLLERLKRFGAVAIYGGTPADERQDIAARFQTDESTRVLIANPAAAGTGFTLTAASYTIYESLSWRYDHYAQSQDRNHRIGQTNPVTYMRMLAVDTIEEVIVQALERKSNLAKSLLGDDDEATAISHLTKEEMCNLLTNHQLPD